MELTDGTILLRRPTPADADVLIAAVRESQREVGRWMAWARADYGRADVDAYVGSARHGDEPFLIIDRGSRMLLGGTGLNQVDGANLRANLGYWVRTSATGRGVATRAARLVAWYGHVQLSLHRLELVVAVGNAASEAVAAKLGASVEGVLRDRLLVGSRHCDAAMHALLPGDTAGWAQRYGLRAWRGAGGATAVPG
ncbi:MAG: GNAT family N-acetyltransferase [Acidimicrobiia bacterium]|nr:GNAT family N-acetyltransferase [Acidimicrobiia bacterium]